jgi:hypothetical protein
MRSYTYTSDHFFEESVTHTDLGIRTLLVWRLLIYLKVIISIYLLQIYLRLKWNIALCNSKSTDYPCLHNEEKLRSSIPPNLHYSNARQEVPLLYMHVLEYSSVKRRMAAPLPKQYPTSYYALVTLAQNLHLPRFTWKQRGCHVYRSVYH